MNCGIVILLVFAFIFTIVAQQGRLGQMIVSQVDFKNIFQFQQDYDTLDWSIGGPPTKVIQSQIPSYNSEIPNYDQICFGAQNVLSRIIKLNSNQQIMVTFTIGWYYKWNDSEFQIFVDDKLVYQWKFAVYNSHVLSFSISLNHNGPTAIFVLTSTLKDTCANMYWSMEQAILQYQSCPPGCSTCRTNETYSLQEDCKFQLLYSYWDTLHANLFKQDGWQVVNGQATVTTCGNIPIFGGFEQTGAGTVISKVLYVPPHYKLKLKVLWVKIDSWDNEAAQIIADGNLVWERRFQKSEGYFGKICGNSDFDSKSLFVKVEVDFDHMGDYVKIQFTTTLNGDSNKKSFGLRDLQIFYTPCSLNCALCTGPNESQCNKCKTNWFLSQGKCILLPNLVILDQSFLNQEIQSYNGWLFYTKNNTQYLISSCWLLPDFWTTGLGWSFAFSIIGGYRELGYGSIAAKTFNIPPHRRLRIQTLVYRIGYWDGEFMVIMVDRIIIWAAQWGSQMNGQFNCVFNTVEVVVDEIFNHQGPKGEVILTSTLWKDGYQYWGFRNFILSYEPMLSCAMIFSECYFKGEKTEICSTQSNFQKSGFLESIKSIRIPPQGRLTLFEKTDYNGKKITYTSDQTCLENSEFSTIYLSGQIEGDQLEGSWVEFDQ